MFWYKRYIAVGSAVLFTLASCRPQGGIANNAKFFDLKAYFKSEATRLAKSDPLVAKTAIQNRESETLREHIRNWDSELSLFAAADINKPAWTKSYRVSEAGEITTYSALDSNLKTQSIVIKKQGDKVKAIFIYNHVRKTLFGKVLNESHENLAYVPDSVYRIQKRQFTRALGFNNYYIKGLFDQ